MASNETDFKQKAADIIGLCINPPQHAAMFCVDEKTAIQALDLLDPVLPLSPGRAERHGFEYYPHGTLSLYDALDVKTGKVQGKTAKRHTSAELVDFLDQLVTKARWAQEIHVVLDNLSAHKTKAVAEFLAEHPKVRFHFTPTYPSWLNQVEIWFANIERDVIARGVFASVADLARKIRKYIRGYAKSAKPFRWKYTDARKEIGNVINRDGPLVAVHNVDEYARYDDFVRAYHSQFLAKQVSRPAMRNTLISVTVFVAVIVKNEAAGLERSGTN